MKTTAVCVVRPPRADLERLQQGVAVLARATRTTFARIHQRGDDPARVKREVCRELGLLTRHFSGCRASALAAARGWRKRLVFERDRLRHRLAGLARHRERDDRTAARRRRNAVRTRQAESRLARVEKELATGRPRHCFGGGSLLRQGRLAEWRVRRDGNALFVGESGKIGGNGVARWDPDARSLELRMPGDVATVTLEGVDIDARLRAHLEYCIADRTPVTWRVELLSRGKVKLCVTFDETEPDVQSCPAAGAVAVDLNADHAAAVDVTGSGQLRGAVRHALSSGRNQVQDVARALVAQAAARSVPVVAEDLDFRKKKAWLRNYGKRFAATLSTFRTGQFQKTLERQCRRAGIELIRIDPAWTSRLAVLNRYPARFRVGHHHAAALVIGRRGLGFAERVPTTATPLARADVKRRGTCGWESTLAQTLPGAWRRGGGSGPGIRSGARTGSVAAVCPRHDRPAGIAASRAAVGPAKASVVRTVA